MSDNIIEAHRPGSSDNYYDYNNYYDYDDDDDNDDADDDNDDDDDDYDDDDGETDDKKQVPPSHIKLIIDAFNILCNTLLLLPPAIT